MVDLKTYRQTVQDAFARELDIQFVPGLLDGPNQTRAWIGSCYLSRVAEVAPRVAEQNMYLTIRVFAPFSSQGSLSPNVPYDPSPLEDMATKIQAVSRKYESGLGAWYQRVVSIEIDPVNQGVQAIVFAWDENASGV